MPTARPRWPAVAFAADAVFALTTLAVLAWRLRSGPPHNSLEDTTTAALTVLVILSVLMLPLLGAFLLAYRLPTRVRASAPSDPARRGSLEIPLTHLRAELERSQRLTGFAIAGVMAAIFGVIARLSRHSVDQLSHRFLFAALALMVVCAIAIPWLANAERRRALRITSGKKLQLVAGKEGLTVPLFLFTNPVFSRLVADGQDHLTLRWKEIKGWSVEQAPAQHVLTVTGTPERYGHAESGPARVTISRGPIAQREGEFLEVVRRNLKCQMLLGDGATKGPSPSKS